MSAKCGDITPSLHNGKLDWCLLAAPCDAKLCAKLCVTVLRTQIHLVQLQVTKPHGFQAHAGGAEDVNHEYGLPTCVKVAIVVSIAEPV
jgi:hypothetical protein